MATEAANINYEVAQYPSNSNTKASSKNILKVKSFIQNRNIKKSSKIERTAWKNSLENSARRTLKLAALAGIALISINSCAPKGQTPSTGPATERIEYEESVSTSSEQLENMGYADFNKLPESTRIEHLGEYLSSDKKIAYTYLLDFLSDEGRGIVTLPDLSKNPTDYSPQDTLNNFTLGVWDASTQGDNIEDINKGKKILSLVISPDHQNFDSTLSLIGNGKGGVIDVYRQLPMDYDSKIFNTSFMGHTVGTGGGDVILGRSLDTGQDFIFLFTNLSTSDGKTVSMLTDSFNSTNTKAKEAIAKLPPKK